MNIVRISRLAACQVLCVLTLLGCRTLLAASGAGLVEQGNRAFAAGKFDEAIAAYERAAAQAPQAAEIDYNRGAAYYRKGDYAKARECFEQAAARATAPDLQARSRMGLGNCTFREAEAAPPQDPQQGLQALERAAGLYEEALRLDPALGPAAHNLEVTRLAIQKLREAMQEAAKQAARDAQERQEKAEKLKDLVQKQQSLQQQTQAAQKPEAGPSPESLAQEQRELQKQTEAMGRELAQQNPSADPQQAKDRESAQDLERAAQAQQQAARALDEKKAPEAEKQQGQALDAMQQALQKLAPPESGDEKKREEQQASTAEPKPPKTGGAQETPGPPPQTEKAETAQPVAPRDEDAHNILQEEAENRQERVLRLRGQISDVEKDW